jgi:hypothetical protein
LEKNVSSFFDRIGTRCHLRQTLIFYLAKDIPSGQAVKIFKFSEFLTKSARQLSEEQIQQTLLFVRKYQRKKNKTLERQRNRTVQTISGRILFASLWNIDRSIPL